MISSRNCGEMDLISCLRWRLIQASAGEESRRAAARAIPGHAARQLSASVLLPWAPLTFHQRRPVASAVPGRQAQCSQQCRLQPAPTTVPWTARQAARQPRLLLPHSAFIHPAAGTRGETRWGAASSWHCPPHHQHACAWLCPTSSSDAKIHQHSSWLLARVKQEIRLLCAQPGQSPSCCSIPACLPTPRIPQAWCLPQHHFAGAFLRHAVAVLTAHTVTAPCHLQSTWQSVWVPASSPAGQQDCKLRISFVL